MIEQFEKFKRRNYKLLFASDGKNDISWFSANVFTGGRWFHSATVMALDIFSWVILWQPIDKLLCSHWNRHLKEISIMQIDW